MQQCRKCGAVLSFGAQYCGQCGARITALPDVSQGATTERSLFTDSEYVMRKKIATNSTFEIENSSGDLVATAKKEIVPLGPAYLIETPDGVRIGELRGSVALLPNRPYLEIRDANGQLAAIIMMRVAKKPGAGFFSIGITSWVIAAPSGEELARINWRNGGHDWSVMGPDGMMAEGHWKWLEIPHDTYEVKILRQVIDPYLVLATIFANPANRSNLT